MTIKEILSALSSIEENQSDVIAYYRPNSDEVMKINSVCVEKIEENGTIITRLVFLEKEYPNFN